LLLPISTVDNNGSCTSVLHVATTAVYTTVVSTQPCTPGCTEYYLLPGVHTSPHTIHTMVRQGIKVQRGPAREGHLCRRITVTLSIFNFST
jgi:hypothetical protein